MQTNISKSRDGYVCVCVRVARSNDGGERKKQRIQEEGNAGGVRFSFENTDTYSDQERSIEKARGMQRLAKRRWRLRLGRKEDRGKVRVRSASHGGLVEIRKERGQRVAERVVQQKRGRRVGGG